MVRLATTIVLALPVNLATPARSQAAPDVNKLAGAANVAPGEARLRGKLLGGGDADVVFYWGPTDCGTMLCSSAWRLDISSEPTVESVP